MKILSLIRVVQRLLKGFDILGWGGGGKREQGNTNVCGQMRNKECCGSVLSKLLRRGQKVTWKRWKSYRVKRLDFMGGSKYDLAVDMYREGLVNENEGKWD